MRTSDFVPLIFPSLPIARRRLLKLMDAGVVAGVVHQLHEDTRWQLDRGGYELLGQADEEKRKSRTVARLLSDPGRHHFTLVRFWALLAHACFSSDGVRLKRFKFEWEAGHVNTLEVHRADAVFTLEHRGQEQKYFLEIDCGTESIKYFAEKKISVFSRLVAATGGPASTSPILIVVVPTEARLAGIAAASGATSASILGAVFTDKSTMFDLRAGWRELGEGQDRKSDRGLVEGEEER